MRAKPRELRVPAVGRLRCPVRSHEAWIDVTRLRAHGTLLPGDVGGMPAPHSQCTPWQMAVGPKVSPKVCPWR